jgi:hypothetical protein
MPGVMFLLSGVASVFGAAFAVVDLRMLFRFLRHRQAIRAGVSFGRQEGRSADGAQASPEEVAPTVTIQIPRYNERTSAERVVRAAAA